MVSYFMTPMTTHQGRLSSADSRRQLEESIARAMDRYRTDFEAVREKSAKLRAQREAAEAEAENAAKGATVRKPARKPAAG